MDAFAEMLAVIIGRTAEALYDFGKTKRGRIVYKSIAAISLISLIGYILT